MESAVPALGTTLHESPVALEREAGPHPIEGLAVEDLRKAKRGALHFEGIGLEGSSPYVSYAHLNRVSLGALPGAGGDEVRGKWAEASLPLSPEAIAKLFQWNHLVITNPGNDSFAIGRFWIELELADGRKCSSQITVTRYKQPPEWPYGSGVGVPFGKDIEAAIRLPVR